MVIIDAFTRFMTCQLTEANMLAKAHFSPITAERQKFLVVCP